MTIHYDPLKQEITYAILNAISISTFNTNENGNTLDFDTVYNSLSIPPDFTLGQIAFPCFILAKSLKKSPIVLAQQVTNLINENSSKVVIAAAIAAGAYINFHCDFNAVLKFEKDRNFEKNFLFPKLIETMMIEYSQPNTHKTLHVGHLRCLVLGDAVCNILEYVGHKVIRATYPGDIGTHVAKVLWYLMNPEPKVLPKSHKPQWLGEMYAKADSALKSLQGTIEELKAKKTITTILQQLSEEHGVYFDLWKETREWSLDYLKSVYDWLNCHFDVWFFESEFDKPSKEFVLEKFKEGFFIQDQGAIGIDLTDYNLGFVMYLKSDGNGLYITKDLLLLIQKLSNPDITKSIYVVDVRQKRHFEQLFKTAELMGYSRATRSFHLSYETVNTETGEPFSSRALKGLEIFELKNKMEERIKTDYLERHRSEWSNQEIDTAAHDVCVGALKYGLLSADNNTQIHFSLSEWLRLDGDTGPYLQYVHARCCRILDKVHEFHNNNENFVFSEEDEKKLLFFIHRFPEVCVQSATNLKPSLIANYLYDLSKLFNRFYESCPILKSDDSMKATRIELVKLTRQTIYTGLKLLGIVAPTKM